MRLSDIKIAESCIGDYYSCLQIFIHQNTDADGRDNNNGNVFNLFATGAHQFMLEAYHYVCSAKKKYFFKIF